MPGSRKQPWAEGRGRKTASFGRPGAFPYRGSPFFLARPQSSVPDPKVTSPLNRVERARPPSPALLPLGDPSPFSDPSLEELGVARPGRETMGLPEQDDTPSGHNSGAAAWEGRWRGPPWGLLVLSSPPPPSQREPPAPLHVQVGQGGLRVLPTSQLHSDTRHFVPGLMVCKACAIEVRDREALPGSPSAPQ